MSDEPKQTVAATAPTAAAGVTRSLKFASGANAVVIMALVLLIAGMANYLAYRHYKVFDWTREGYYELSSQTQTVLKNLDKDLRVIMLVSPQVDIYDYLKTLLGEYAAQSPRIQIEYLDPAVGDFTRRKALADQFKIDLNEANVIIFQYGDRSKYLKHDQFFSDFVDYSRPEFGMGAGDRRIVNFKAEDAFTSTILGLTEAKQSKVYFLLGHGEKSPDDARREGISALKSSLVRQNILVETLTLSQSGKIPEDCDALAIVGPAFPLSEAEVSLIDGYLDNKGRLVLMLDPDTRNLNLSTDYGFGALLSKWNVSLGKDIIVNRPRAVAVVEGKVLGTDPIMIYAQSYGAHPITEALKDAETEFPIARTVKEAATTPAADRPRVTALVKTSAESFAETSATELSQARSTSNYAFTEGVDPKGPLSLAVAVESGNPGGGVEIGSTRLVVVGNSSCVVNGTATEANIALGLNSVNWLLERKKAMGIPPKQTRSYKLELTRKQFLIVTLSATVGLPLFAACIGAMVWWRRRR